MADENIAASQGQRFNKQSSVLLLLVYVLLICSVLVQSRMGRYATPILGVDWAHHMSLVETLYSDGDRDVNDRIGNLAEMSGYPDGSHWAVVYLANFCHISPLQSIQIWVGVLTLTASFLLVLKWNLYIHSLPGHNIWLRYVLLAAWALFAAYMGVNASGHTASNFFFAQLFGTVIAIGVHYLLQRGGLHGTIRVCLVIVTAGVLLPNIHLLPAVWFLTASLLCLFAEAETLSQRLRTCIAVVGTVGACWWTNTSVWRMVKIAENNGDFVIRSGIVKSSAIILFPTALVLLCAVWALVWTQRTGLMTARRYLSQTSGLISVLVLVLLQATTLLIAGRQGTYSLAKYLYFLSFEVPAILVFVPVPFEKYLFPRFGSFSSKTWTPVALGLLFLCQAPFVSYVYDQTTLLRVRDKLVDYRSRYMGGDRKYPEFPELSPPMNYYLATGLMRIPRDQRTEAWFVGSHATGDRSIEPAALTSAAGKYDYRLTLTESDRSQLGSGLPERLHFAVVIPQVSSFAFARALPTKRGEVALGYHAINKTGVVLYEGRSILSAIPGTKGGFESYVATNTLPPGAVALRVGIVEENITWFNEQRHTALDVIAIH
jgi:hypothetical protein